MATANIYNENLKTETSKEVFENNDFDVSLTQVKLNHDQDLHYLYQQAPASVILSIVAALLVTWFVIPVSPEYLTIPWLTFIVFSNFVHLLLIKEFNKNKKNLHINNQWAIYHTIIVGINALAFSIGYLLFLPLVSEFIQVTLLMILAIMAVANLPVLSVFLPAYIVFISAFIFPIIFWIYSLPLENSHRVTTLFAITYCMLIVVSSYYSRAILEAFGLAAKINKKIKILHEILEKTKTLNIRLKQDAYESMRNHDELYQEKTLAEFTLQSIGEGVISTDHNGKIKYINPIAEVYTGWSAKDVKGECLYKVLNIIDETTRIKLPDPIDQCLQNKTPVNSNSNSILIRRDGLEYAVDYSITPILCDDYQTTGTVMVFRDVTENRMMQRDLNWQAEHDPLTGLINRREFDQCLKKIINDSDMNKHEHTLCYINLDHFKLVNDSCGFEAGDKLLKIISQRMKKVTRDTDTLARIGSDEFAIIMYSCSLAKAKLIADILQEKVFNKNFQWENKSFNITASIGMTSLNNTCQNLAEIKRSADIACYQAKNEGGNQVAFYNQGQSGEIKYKGELKILEDLQRNLKKESFKLYTQSIEPLDNYNDVIFHEVLLRMESEEGNLLPASYFIETAKNYHMLSDIDNWVFKVVMEMIAYGNPVFNKSNIISINLSQQSTLNEKFVTYVIDLLTEYDVPSSNICFEINEPLFYENIDLFKRFVSLIKNQGCRIALDNFNYNPTSINLVKKLAIDYIKLDARHFRNLDDKKDFNYTLLESINKINHLVGAQTIIKCIDTEDIIESLHQIGTDYVQGNAIEEPKPINGSVN